MSEPNDVVTLRRATSDDAPMLLAIRVLPITRRHQPTIQHDMETMQRLLAASAARSLSSDISGKITWIIEHDGVAAGWISLDIPHHTREHGIGAVGYALRPAFHGLRVASRSVRLLVPIAFNPGGLALERLEANVAVENIASQHVLEAAGFRREGIARGLLLIAGERIDHYSYGLLRTDLPGTRET